VRQRDEIDKEFKESSQRYANESRDPGETKQIVVSTCPPRRQKRTRELPPDEFIPTNPSAVQERTIVAFTSILLSFSVWVGLSSLLVVLAQLDDGSMEEDVLLLKGKGTHPG
jgi:hypothetical protein